ncbi:hypothetical protein [Dinoroseobacter sp. S76]|uniref:hypothetical protein n=1 Tax=Dinoroseobacter sp. S76 TaxID=3415124 RepID=UPI003C7D5DAE
MPESFGCAAAARLCSSAVFRPGKPSVAGWPGKRKLGQSNAVAEDVFEQNSTTYIIQFPHTQRRKLLRGLDWEYRRLKGQLETALSRELMFS